MISNFKEQIVHSNLNQVNFIRSTKLQNRQSSYFTLIHSRRATAGPGWRHSPGISK